jgi:hypothetical protein
MRKVVLSLVATLAIASLGVAADGPVGLKKFEAPKGPALVDPPTTTCIDVDLELLPGPSANTHTLSVEITNCGDGGGLIAVAVTLDANGQTFGPFTHNVYVGAGESLVRSISFAVPPPVPAGSYSVCVEATSGGASAQDCATLAVAD